MTQEELDKIVEQHQHWLKGYCEGFVKYRRAVYDKSEADKVIADLEESHKKEVTQLLMEIVELKEKYKELAKLHDKAIQACCDADKVIAHHKYKRCLAMAKWCHNESLWWYSKGYGFEKYDKFWEKWEKRWLELAEQFKDKEEAK